MRKTVMAKNNMINLSEHHIYMPKIESLWSYGLDKFYSKFQFHPDTGKEITEEDIESWYLPVKKRLFNQTF